MTSTSTVAAVIVTFNRSSKLLRTLQTVAEQSYPLARIYVIDNASTDDTEAIVSGFADSRVEYVKLAKNIGGAGGFNRGMRIGYEAGYDYLWLLDDDGYPRVDALDKLVSNTEEFTSQHKWKAGFACSSVRWVNGDLCEMNTPQVVWDWPRFYSPDLPLMLVRACSFVSVLIPRWAIKEHGLPIADYFIWYDDIEYTLRLSRSFPGLFCLNSIVIHDIPENKGVNFSLVTDGNVWKYCYGVRNEASYRAEQGLGQFIVYAADVWSGLRSGGIRRKLKFQIYGALWRGFWFRPKRESVD